MIYVLNNSKYFENLAIIISKVLKMTMVETLDYDLDITYLIFNMKDIAHMPKKYIIYNFEQLQILKNINTNILEKFRNSIKIFDYSEKNIEILKKYNINAIFAPYGYNVLMKIDNIPFSERVNTVMFLGYLNIRRIRYLKPVHTLCKNNNYNMFLNNKCWNDEYLQMLKITKIALNIHCNDGEAILEVHRIIPYILNKIYVISERSYDPYYDSLFDNLVTWVDDKNDIVTAINNALNLPIDNMETILVTRQRLLIETCPFSTTINNILCNNLIN